MGETKSEDYLDPPTLDPVKAYFKILQCIHHLEILENCLKTKVCPMGMKRKVEKLASFIKPASPDSFIQTVITAHTESWLWDCIMALRNHYADLADAIHSNLGPFQPAAECKAIKWARSRYRRKLTPSSIASLQRKLLITYTAVSHQPPPIITPAPLTANPKRPPPSSTISTHPTTPLPTPIHKHSPTPTPTAKHNPAHTPGPKPNPAHIPAANPNSGANPTSTHNPKHTPAATPTSRTQPLPLPPIIKPPPSARSSSARHRVLFKAPNDLALPQGFHQPFTTPPPKLPPLSSSRSSSVLMPPPAPPSPSSYPPLLPTPPPKVRVRLADTDWPFHFHPTEQQLAQSITPPALSTPHAITSHTPPSPLSPHLPPPCSSSSPRLPVTGSASSSSSSLTPVGPTVAVDRPSHATSGQSMTLTPAPPVNRNRLSLIKKKQHYSFSDPNHWEPVCHRDTQRKNADWAITIRKSVVFLGDSNLSNIPPLQDKDIQIDSFPDAHIRHFTELLNALPHPDPRPTTVVFSIGLQNCVKTNHDTTIRKDLLRLLRVANIQFPMAKVWFTLINDHPGLPDDARARIRVLNDILTEKTHFLPEINQQLFQLVSQGSTQWTANTAQCLFENWLSELFG